MLVGTGNPLPVSPIVTTTYYVQASACGTSTICRSVTIKVIPPAPVATLADNITQTGFSAHWNASPGATGYYLDVSTNSSFTSILKNYKNKKVSSLTLAVSGLTANTTYFYRVRAYNSVGTGPNSNTISLTTNSLATKATVINTSTDTTKTSFPMDRNASAMEIGNISKVNSLNTFKVSIYPNPTQGPVNFDINTEINSLVVSVFNITGVEVFHKEYQAPKKISFDLSQNPAGLYMVKLSSGDVEYVKRVVLNK